ncbi:MAG: hypothetical protein LUH36_00870 [Oscillospiraceae bacterium]|nr:hypothetical protein [Oscillospiraceae bacterium]
MSRAEKQPEARRERKITITKLGLFVNTGVALALTALCILLSLYTDKYIDTLVSLTLGWLAENGVYNVSYTHMTMPTN